KQSREDAPIKGRSTNEGEAAAERIKQIDAQVARELEEKQDREDMRMNEQIARDAEVARIHAEEEIQVWKQVEDFIPMGSKEESKRLKRKGLNIEKEKVKKQKSSEEPPEFETITKEFTEEKIKEMM
nr:hypothetical protein [Tanacetum cinerariifolium]